MSRGLSWLCLAGGFIAPFAGAQPVAPLADSLTSYLFLVDTSFSMRREQATVRNLAYDLVRSGINGRMHAGDGFTVWTFNDEVHTDRFPPQSWLPELNQALAKRTYEFLRHQRCERQTRMDKAMTMVTKLMRATGSLTVFLITDGDDTVEGTPFDRDLNAVYLHRYRELRRARKPFVTALVARDGQWVAWAVYAAGDPLVVPGEPVSVARRLAPPLSPAAPVPGPSPPPSPTVQREQHAPPAATPVPSPSKTVLPTAVLTPELAPKPTAPATSPAAKPVSVVPPSVPSQPGEPAPSRSPPAAVTSAGKEAVARPQPAPPTASSTASATQVVAPASPAVLRSPPSVGKLNPLPTPATGSTNNAEVTRHGTDRTSPRSSPPAPVTAQSLPSTAPTSAASTARAGQTAIVVPPAPAAGRALLFFGVALLLLAFGLIGLLIRRGRVRPGSSLITRSIDGRGK